MLHLLSDPDHPLWEAQRLGDGHPPRSLDEKALFAIKGGLVAVALELLERPGLDVNYGNGAMLRAACAANIPSLADILLRMGASAAAQQSAAATSAARNGNLNLLRLLKNYKANVRANFDEPLVAAAGRGHIRVVEFLLNNGADVNTREGLPLTKAAAKGQLHMVQYLITRGALPNVYFDAPLVAAAEGGYLDIVRLLVEKHNGAVKARDCDALVRASAGGHASTVYFLIASGAADSARARCRATAAAAANGHDELVMHFFAALGVSWKQIYEDDSHPDVLTRGPLQVISEASRMQLISPRQAQSILLAAALAGRLDIVTFLLERPPVVPSDAKQAIKPAIEAKQVATAEALLEGCQQGLSEEDKNGLLLAAMFAGLDGLVGRLLEMGARLRGESFYDIVAAAAKSGSLEQMHWLSNMRIDIAAYAQRCLPAAMEGGNVAILRLLLSSRAILNQREHQSYFYAAATSAKLPMLSFLLEAMPTLPPNYELFLICAARSDAKKMARHILKSHLVAPIGVDKAVIAAAGRGHIEMVRCLLLHTAHAAATSSISEPLLLAAFKEALDGEHVEMARFLLALDGHAHHAALASVMLEGGTRGSSSHRDSPWCRTKLALANDIVLQSSTRSSTSGKLPSLT